MHEQILSGLVRAWKERAPKSRRAIHRFVQRHRDALLADILVLLSGRPASGPWFERGDLVAMLPEHGLTVRGEVWNTEIREGRQSIQLRRGKWWPSSSFALEAPPADEAANATAGPITDDQLEQAATMLAAAMEGTHRRRKPLNLPALAVQVLGPDSTEAQREALFKELHRHGLWRRRGVLAVTGTSRRVDDLQIGAAVATILARLGVSWATIEEVAASPHLALLGYTPENAAGRLRAVREGPVRVEGGRIGLVPGYEPPRKRLVVSEPDLSWVTDWVLDYAYSAKDITRDVATILMATDKDIDRDTLRAIAQEEWRDGILPQVYFAKVRTKVAPSPGMSTIDLRPYMAGIHGAKARVAAALKQDRHLTLRAIFGVPRPPLASSRHETTFPGLDFSDFD